MTRSRLDPDALAALEEERAFLLRSLDDLDREHAAGDIDDDDYRELADGYTVRTAEVLRALDEQRVAFEGARRPRSAGRTALVVGAVAVVALLAGVLVAQASGRREVGETVSGADIPQTPTQRARACLPKMQAAPGDAIECFQAVLDDVPDNPTALTYLAWTLVLTSGSLPPDLQGQTIEAAKGFLERATTADPTFPDAWAFTAIVAAREERWADAKTALDALDALQPPADIRSLVADLRTEVETALRTPSTPSTTTVTTVTTVTSAPG